MIAAFQSQPRGVIGFLDEVWWNRFALPHVQAWQSQHTPLHLQEYATRSSDRDPKALGCYGVLWKSAPGAEAVDPTLSLRFVTGRLVSAITTQFLDWCCAQLEAQGKTRWLLIWDNAPWHTSKLVYSWLLEHNQQVYAQQKGVEIVPCWLPSKSPWLNAIEPKWAQAKRAIVEPNRLLTAAQLTERVCEFFHAPVEPSLALPQKVA